MRAHMIRPVRLVQFIEVPSHLAGIDRSLRDLGLIPSGLGADITVSRYRIPDGTDASAAYALAVEVVEAAERELNEAAARRSTLTSTPERPALGVEVAIRKNGLVGRVVKKIDRTDEHGRQVAHYVLAVGPGKIKTVPVSACTRIG